MRLRHIAVAGLALASATASAAEPTIMDFHGAWQGTDLQVTGDIHGVALEPADLDVQIEAGAGGLRISWTGLARQAGGELAPHRFDARFDLTDRPGVYAFEPDKTSFFGLFADPATGNPLDGETLLWARLAGATLTVYNLSITFDGGFDLDRYARTLGDGGMEVHYTHRMENNRVVTIDGRLERKGG